MIITEQKPIQEIEENVKKYNKIFIVGCGDCCAVCRTGGTEEVKAIIERFKEDGIIVDKSIVIQAPCDQRVSKRDLQRVKDDIDAADALLVMACGLGVQSIARLTGKPVIAANNTKFMGIVYGMGTSEEVCIGCDSCTLNENGKCEVVLRKICKKCGRMNAYDAKFCDQCKAEEFDIMPEARKFVFRK
ncbi:MAG: methylenetetrahydrofolate reductase C-terminal domain-containing protein [Candidatus Helarchaeota archaeon]